MPLILQPSTKENAIQRVELRLASMSDDPIDPLADVPYPERVQFFGERMLESFAASGARSLEVVETETG
jgi:hypothetical protein